jgi:ribosomal protein S18 acetylase RimI-like enzyme
MTTVQGGLGETAHAHPLDNPAWASLSGPHAHLALGGDKARRYPADMSPFTALADSRDPEGWTQLAGLAGPSGLVLMCERPETLDHLPAGWSVVHQIPGVQMVATDALRTAPDPEAVQLGPDDVDDMFKLVARSEPGPFEPRTRELGTYLGLRREGRLAAMVGERMHPTGYTEVSAVTTDPDFRSRGFAGRLVRAVAHGIVERGETPMLHASATNLGAIRLYESLGFAERRRPLFMLLKAPQDA